MGNHRIASVPLMESLIPLIKENLAEGREVRFMPNGDSMRPMLRPGIDSVVLSPAPQQLKKYDLPLYQRDNGKYTLHRIVAAAEHYTCMGDNQFAAEAGVRHEQVIGVVTAFYRGEKRHTAEEPAYRLYCIVWYRTIRLRYFLRRSINWLRRHLLHK